MHFFMANSIPASDKVRYEAPRADVCGVFLCENMAVGAEVSVLTGGITQEDWGSDSAASQDLWLAY
jgi:hypothetical protein